MLNVSKKPKSGPLVYLTKQTDVEAVSNSCNGYIYKSIEATYTKSQANIAARLWFMTLLVFPNYGLDLARTK